MTVVSAPTQTKTRAERIPSTTILLYLVAAIGMVLRIARWTHWRSLWLDEIYLASSLDRSLHDLLFKPLNAWQTAPPGFLLLLHCVRQIFGPGERSLRLPSLFFGLASIPLFIAVAGRMLRPIGAIVATGLFVFLGPLIYYSNEVKPYSCDVAASLAITLVVLRWMESRTTRRAVIAALVGFISVFFSYPAVFVLAGAGVWMLFTTRHRGVFPICIAWAAAFAAEYLIFLRPLTQADVHQRLVQYWITRGGFMPEGIWNSIAWVFSSFAAIAANPGSMWLQYPDAAALGLVVGAAVAIHRRNHLLLLIAPLPFILLAAAIRQYPFADRLTLFFVPQYLLLIALAAQSLWTTFPGKSAAVALIGLILIPSAQRAVVDLVHPPGREESLPVYRWIADRYRPGDVLYLTRFAEPSFDYYRSQISLPETADFHTQPECADFSQVLADVKSLAGKKRVWVILIHADATDGNGAVLTLAAFNEIGASRMIHEEPGTSVHLFDCSNQ